MGPRLVVLLLALAAGACSNTNLGDIDESVDSREQMPGPGIFDGEDGESALSWSSDSSADRSVAAQQSSADQRAEFEQFKAWQALREQGEDSPEYREFRQWLEFQKFKSGQE